MFKSYDPNKVKESLNKLLTMNEIPRRCQLDKLTLAELAIHNAIQEIERMGANVTLTRIISTLNIAKDMLSDYVDRNLPIE